MKSAILIEKGKFGSHRAAVCGLPELDEQLGDFLLLRNATFQLRPDELSWSGSGEATEGRVAVSRADRRAGERAWSRQGRLRRTVRGRDSLSLCETRQPLPGSTCHSTTQLHYLPLVSTAWMYTHAECFEKKKKRKSDARLKNDWVIL